MLSYRILFIFIYLSILEKIKCLTIKEKIEEYLPKHMPKQEINKELINKIQSMDEPILVANGMKFYHNKKSVNSDIVEAKTKIKILQQARSKEKRLNHGRDLPQSKMFGNLPQAEKTHYHMDPVLNQMRRQNQRRRGDRSSVETEDSGSSSLGVRDWREDFEDLWLQKKYEAVNSTLPRGDVVNMVAARPWGVACGDPQQHDMPWGTCTTPNECEPEYRIYRGDFFCAGTMYVCCVLQLTNYDLYQGFDVSFQGSSFASDSDEKKNRGKTSKDKKKKSKNQEKRKRARERRKRKKKIKKTIRTIVREIRKILDKAYKNATLNRQKRTQLLKKFIKSLKKKYMEDRNAVRKVHTKDLENIDTELIRKLEQISILNANFIRNETFRNILFKKKITKKGERMLEEAYPELKKYFRHHRRDGGGSPGQNRDYYEYDIEYGALYY